MYCHFDRPPYQSTATTESPWMQKCFSLSSFVTTHLHTYVRNIVVVFTWRWNHLPTFKINQLELPILSTTHLASCTYEYLKTRSPSYFWDLNNMLRYGRSADILPIYPGVQQSRLWQHQENQDSLGWVDWSSGRWRGPTLELCHTQRRSVCWNPGSYRTHPCNKNVFQKAKEVNQCQWSTCNCELPPIHHSWPLSFHSTLPQDSLLCKLWTW